VLGKAPSPSIKHPVGFRGQGRRRWRRNPLSLASLHEYLGGLVAFLNHPTLVWYHRYVRVPESRGCLPRTFPSAPKVNRPRGQIPARGTWAGKNSAENPSHTHNRGTPQASTLSCPFPRGGQHYLASPILHHRRNACGRYNCHSAAVAAPASVDFLSAVSDLFLPLKLLSVRDFWPLSVVS